MAKEITDRARRLPVGRMTSFFGAPMSLEELAQHQGVKRFDFDELIAMEERWPEEESVDEFIASVREWRTEGKRGRLS